MPIQAMVGAARPGYNGNKGRSVICGGREDTEVDESAAEGEE